MKPELVKFTKITQMLQNGMYVLIWLLVNGLSVVSVLNGNQIGVLHGAPCRTPLIKEPIDAKIKGFPVPLVGAAPLGSTHEEE